MSGEADRGRRPVGLRSVSRQSQKETRAVARLLLYAAYVAGFVGVAAFIGWFV